MPAPLRLAVVGAGNWSTAMHLPAFRRMRAEDGVVFAAVCDLNLERAKAYAQALGAEAVYDDLGRMCEAARPDGLAILVQPEAAARVMALAIERKLPFVIEKPPAPDADTHRNLRDAAGNLPHVVAYNRRHCAYILEARKWMKDEALQSISVHFTRYGRREQFDSTLIHAVDTVRCLAGAPFERLRLELAPGAGVTNFFLHGWTRSGARVDLLIAPNTGSAMEHYWVRSERRAAFVSFPQRSMYDVPGGVELHEANRLLHRKSATDFGIDPAAPWDVGGMLSEHRHFCAVLKGTESSRATLDDTLQTQEVRDAIVRLLAAGPRGEQELVFSA